MTKAKLLKFLLFWCPMGVVVLMAIASLVCLYLGLYRKAGFWFLDAAITFWSAFLLN